MREFWKEEKVKELCEQEEANFKPLDLYHRLKKAAILRYLMVNRVFKSPLLKSYVGLEFILRYVHSGLIDIPIGCRHPILDIFLGLENDISSYSETSLESLFLILVLDEIARCADVELAKALHFYLLTVGFVNRLLVQQLSQKGFDQFQKITIVQLREKPEAIYTQRFLQLHGNTNGKGSIIEGRFSPEKSAQKNLILQSKISNGWVKAEKRNTESRANLALVAHFIKKPEKKCLDITKLSGASQLALQIRHRSYRTQVWYKARALARLLEYQPRGRAQFVGVDAASNELDAPPEVFAASYRYLRKHKLKHFTYHVGEDYHHLVSGLRAMWEAIEFLNLGRGDRIGHGTAAAIDPELWLRKVGHELYLRKGEWLDNMIFTHSILSEKPNINLKAPLNNISNEIHRLSIDVYGKPYCPAVHIAAWKLRRHCPMHLLYREEEAHSQIVWSSDEWVECAKILRENEIYELLRQYHTCWCRNKYDDMIIVPTSMVLNPQLLRSMQDMILSMMHDKEIVLECLPTSNVRISFYKDYSEHHLWRLLGLNGNDKDLRLPPVVLGSDDPGIFATNIGNEYRHVYHQLITTFELTHAEARAKIEELCTNASTYYFGDDKKKNGKTTTAA